MATVEAIILAGGYGSRMGASFEDNQKCVLPIDGKPIIGHVLDALVGAFGSVDVKIAVGHRADKVIDYVKGSVPNKIRATFVPDCNRGTAAAHLMIDQYIKGDFISLPGDIILCSSAYSQVFELFELSMADAAMVLSPELDEADSHPVAKLDGCKVVELLQPAPSCLDSDYFRVLGIYASNRHLFELIRGCQPLPDGSGLSNIFISCLSEVKLVGVNYRLPWVHVAYPEDLEKSFVNRIKPAP